MQTQKDDIRERILTVARDTFMRSGYQKASMRRIATLSGVGVGNIYNYFKSKDHLFCHIVSPVVSSMYKMLDDHHSLKGQDIMQLMNEDYLHIAITEYISLIRNNRELMTLLLFKAQGSSLEDFKKVFTHRSTAQVQTWLAAMKKIHPEISTDFSELFLHLHTVWMFAMFEEVLINNMNDSTVEQVITEYIRFEIEGWKSLFKLKLKTAI